MRKSFPLLQALNREELLALVVASSLFLSSIEYLLPRPVPFFRFGLSNIVLLLILREFRIRDIYLILILRVTATGIMHGTIASYVFFFSLFGVLAAASAKLCAYWLLRKKIGLLGLSLIGAAASNSAQILLSILFIFGKSSIVIAPYLLLFGFFSGFIVGILAEYFYCNSILLGHIYNRYRTLAKETVKRR